MTAIRKTKACRTVVWLLTAAMTLSLMPVCLTPAVAQDGVRTILVLPAADNSGLGMSDLGRLMADELILALAAYKGFSAIEFDRNSPLVKRAVTEGRLLPVQVEMTRPTPAEAIKIAHALGMQAVVLLTIESAVVTDQPNQAKLGVAGELYSIAANYNEQTGDIAAQPQAERTFSVVGASRELTRYDGPKRALVREAVKDASRQIAATTAGEPPTPTRPAKGDNGTRWLTWLVLLGGLAVLVSRSGDNGGDGAVGVPAPNPVSVAVEAGGIRLKWGPPTNMGALQLNHYQIQRSIDGNAWQYIDGGLATDGVTEWFDGSLLPGNYRYRISAVYSTQQVSDWASFFQIAVP